MKHTVRFALTILLLLSTLLTAIACTQVEKAGAWESAIHLSDKTLGTGEKTVVVEVAAEDQKVTFTIKTDKSTVGDALSEHGLIEGDEGDFGLYVKRVNGIEADYDKDQTYWAFYIDGEYGMTGVDLTEIEEGVVYRLEKSK